MAGSNYDSDISRSDLFRLPAWRNFVEGKKLDNNNYTSLFPKSVIQYVYR